MFRTTLCDFTFLIYEPVITYIIPRLREMPILHNLKGVIGIFEVRDASEAALRLEEVGRTSDWAHVEEASNNMVSELERVTQALRSYLDKEKVPSGQLVGPTTQSADVW